MRVMFVAAEFAPIVKVGGLGEASAGLVGALRSAGVEADVVIPDYDKRPLESEVREPLAVPAWAGPATARHGLVGETGPITMIDVPGIERPHPYVDTSTGESWADNDRRFLAFGAAVAELVALDPPDVVHLNDWHTSAATAFADPIIPTVLTVHNLAHQGRTGRSWLEQLGPRRADFDHDGHVNVLAGGIRLADAVVAVSASYAREILQPEMGAGLSDVLAAKGDALAGSDLVLIPSRFEPCGLTQMQAMSYGTIPVVTDVGGLRDTVIDLDRNARQGDGFIADRPDSDSVTKAVCRAVLGWKNPDRRVRAQHRGMTTDWSRTQPATQYIDLDHHLVDRRRR